MDFILGGIIGAVSMSVVLLTFSDCEPYRIRDCVYVIEKIGKENTENQEQ